MKEDKLLKIGLITCASNFETQQNAIKYMRKALKKTCNCALYVFTNYGIFHDGSPMDAEKIAIYDLLDYAELDGCIIDGNIGSITLASQIADKLKRRNIPFITVNLKLNDVPFVTVDSYMAQLDILKLLIEHYGCRKINVVLYERADIISDNMFAGYKEALEKNGIPFDENRVVRTTVSVPNGKAIYYEFEKRNVLDAEATVFIHDVLALSFCTEYMAHGYKVPDDMKLCSLSSSSNSVVFRPSITGVWRDLDKLADFICEKVLKLIDHEEIEMENYYSGTLFYGESCEGVDGLSDYARCVSMHQQVIYGKIGAGTQISQGVEFVSALEDVASMDDFAESLHTMMTGISCDEYFCLLNPSTVDFIENKNKKVNSYTKHKFEKKMQLLIGNSKRSGKVKDKVVKIEDLLPYEAANGDVLIISPIGYKGGCFGYISIINSYLPIEVYNYRICHESIGISIQNLHRKLELKRSVEELDELHMTDPMTGLRNRFAIARSKHRFYNMGCFAIVMIDMDGLKGINDTYGHLAGNNAICITANAIKDTCSENDVIIRYGGDEFLIITENTDLSFWTEAQQRINSQLNREGTRQKLPYLVGISLGCAINTSADDEGFNICLEEADMRMYENKRGRKKGK